MLLALIALTWLFVSAVVALALGRATSIADEHVDGELTVPAAWLPHESADDLPLPHAG